MAWVSLHEAGKRSESGNTNDGLHMVYIIHGLHIRIILLINYL